jgi:hypothetical protein
MHAAFKVEEIVGSGEPVNSTNERTNARALYKRKY